MRFNTNNQDAFGTYCANDTALIIINSAKSEFCASVSLGCFENCIGSSRIYDLRHSKFGYATDILTNERLQFDGKLISLDMEGESFKIIGMK